MALKRKDNGEYVITSKAQVKKALLLMQELKDEIEEARKEAGIDEMEMDAVELKKASERYMVEKGETEIDLGDGRYGRLIQAGYDRRWILTDAELKETDAKGAKSLRRILKTRFGPKDFKEVWKRVSKRVADPEGIQECIDDGTITENEIRAAFVEKEKKPFLRVYGSLEDA